MSKDPNYAVKVEKGYCREVWQRSVVNPKSQWDDEKERKRIPRRT